MRSILATCDHVSRSRQARHPASAIPTLTDYTATRAAIEGFSEGASRDPRLEGVTVNVIGTGAVETEMNPTHAPLAEWLGAVCALGRCSCEPRSWLRVETRPAAASPEEGGHKRRWSALSAVVSVGATEGRLEQEWASGCSRFRVGLDEVGRPSSNGADRHLANPMFYAPPTATSAGQANAVRSGRAITLQFEEAAVSQLVQGEFRPSLPSSSRDNFFDERLFALAKLFEAECLAEGASDLLYGDSLTIGLLSLLARIESPPAKEFRSGGLTPRQLGKVIDHMEAKFADTVTLQALAGVANLSPSHFCRVFRASTGASPHKWLNSLRIRKAKFLLAETDESLAHIALATGFSDQPHLTRVFAKLTGVAPGAWRRRRLD